MPFTKSQRLQALPPYLFIEIDKKKRSLLAAGKDVINLGVGDPDLPTHKFIIDEMAKAIYDPKNHRYPFDEGVPAFRQAAAAFMKKRFHVDVNADTQILTTIGSKDGLAHLPLAIVNHGDVVLVPQPAYPVYNTGTIFSGGQPYIMPLLEKNDFLPDFDAIPENIKQKTKLVWLNYPNNPTAATAPLAFYQKAIALAHKYGWVIANDLAYGEVYFEESPKSILEVHGAMDVAIEFHSLSKSFNMTGWRIGWATGNPAVVAALGQVKGNVDSGQFNAIQVAGKIALENHDHPDVKKQMAIYRQRRDALYQGLTGIGWKYRNPKAGFFCWVNTPNHANSMDLCSRLIEDAYVVTVPGGGFGPAGEGYLRMALTVDVGRIQDAVGRIAKLKL
ncbi:MAG: LL-diaminopimelate aminotransferase [Phycisphaerales bacterium]|nr:LL-diaminopimelate aminotransferase [Phycisphaerales bacterium]